MTPTRLYRYGLPGFGNRLLVFKNRRDRLERRRQENRHPIRDSTLDSAGMVRRGCDAPIFIGNEWVIVLETRHLRTRISATDFYSFTRRK